jgi:hypothetical protein
VIDPILFFTAIAVVGALVVAMLPRSDSEHDECLKNIGKLEMELFPDLPKDLRWAKWPGKTGWGEPGQIIAINSGEKIDWLAPPTLSPYVTDLTRPTDQWHPVGELH